MPAWHAPILVEQLAAPPPVFGRSSDGDDIVRLEIKLFRNRRGVVVKCSYYIGKARNNTKRSAKRKQGKKEGKEGEKKTHRRIARPVRRPCTGALAVLRQVATEVV